MRKTFEVEKLKKMINARIEKGIDPEARQELAAVLRTVLHETGNYNGFNYVDWYNGGCDLWRAAGEPQDNTPYLGDLTKVFFY